MAAVECRRGAWRRRWTGILAASAMGLAPSLLALPSASASTCQLVLYQRTGRIPGWHTTVLSGVGPWCPSTPAIVRSPTGTEIAVVGGDGSIWFYWNSDGSKAWYSSQVAGPGTAVGSLAMARVGNGTVIVYNTPPGIDSGTNSYWNADGSGSWLWCGGVGPAGSYPAMVADSTEVETAAVGFGELEPFETDAGCGGESGNTIYANGGPPRLDMDPAIARTPLGTVATADSSGALWFFWHFDSDYFSRNWYSAPVGNGVANAGDPAMTRTSNGTGIASVGADGSLWLYSNTDGASPWYSAQVAGPYSASLSPAIARFSDGTEIAATRSDSSLWLYSNTDGTWTWYRSEVAGPGGTRGGSPAMTHSASTTEIAVVA